MNPLHAFLAKTPLDHLAAEQLSYQVLCRELGTSLAHPADLNITTDNGLCQHIVVQTEQGLTIGSARMRTQVLAEIATGYHAEQFFHFNGLVNRLSGSVLELDQMCVHKSYRERHVLQTLWKALSEVVHEYRIDHILLLIPLIKTQLNSAYVMQHSTAAHLQIDPITPLSMHNAQLRIPAQLTLLVDQGARFCGPPAWDEEGGCGQALMLLNIDETPIPLLYSKQR